MEARRIVTVENANVKTALIQINQLTIGGTQKMTQKIFRQIKEEDIIDFDNGCLKGNPWGIINYFWADNKEYQNTHLHLLWQLGNELRRCLIIQKGYEDKYGKYIIGNEDNITTLSADSTKFKNNPFLLSIKLKDSLLKNMLKLVGVEIPVFASVPLKNFHEKMKDFLNAWDRCGNWYSQQTITSRHDLSPIALRDYFWEQIAKLYPEAEEQRMDMNRVALSVIQPAYELYMDNHIHQCNRFVKDIIKSTEQVFI
jgi:hypothetical protein